MLKRTLLIIVIALFYCISGFGQKMSLDSMMALNGRYHKMDNIKYTLYCRIGAALRNIDPQKSLLYADSGIIVARLLNDHKALAGALSQKGNFLMKQGRTEEAFKFLDTALILLKNYKDADAIRGNQSMLYQLGFLYKMNSNFDKALEMFNRSLDISYKIKDASMIFNNTININKIYISMGDFQSALNTTMEMKKNWEDLYEQKIVKNPLFNVNYSFIFAEIANLQMKLKRYQESLKNFDTALILCDSIKSSSSYQTILAMANMGLAELYFKTNDYKKSYSKIGLPYQYFKTANQPEELCSVYILLGRIIRDAPDNLLPAFNLRAETRNDSAMSLFISAKTIAEKLHSLPLRESVMEDLSILNEKMGNYQIAYTNYKDFKIIHDSLANGNQQKRILVNDMNYSFKRKTDSLKFAQSLLESGYRQQIIKQQQQALLADKEEQLQHLAYLKSQAELENKDLENKKNLQELSLSKQERELQLANVKQLASDKQVTAYQLKQQRMYGYMGIGFLALLFPFLYVTNYQRRKRREVILAKEKSEHQLNESLLKNRMSEVSLMALRSQMNPHFIFNCLNSIKLFTMENDTEQATDYISKFSRLIRNMLDNSRSDRVTLASDIDSIKLYIELEAMRFKNKLQHQIEVDKNIDTEFIELPPLLIQPYIENAIWHGLMPKKEGGHINIHISQNIADNLLLINISDDGIGREAAAVINSNKQHYHKSMGTAVTGERIALINEKYQSKADVTITDLFKNNQPSGTQVTIKLPLE
ncbi:MAG: histidine kinase [Ginsengibacter sp.]